MSLESGIVFSDGKIAVPDEVQEHMHLVEGARLRVVSATQTELRLEREEKPDAVDGREPIWLGNRWYVPNDDWRSLQGILTGHPKHDTTEERRKEREWEREHDERKFGPFPKH